MAAPCVLLASCAAQLKASELVRQILSVDELPSHTPRLESIVGYPWSVNTKYYTAEIELCTTESRTIGDEQFAESVEAFIVYFDCTQTESFEQVKMWLPYLKLISPSVLMLVCDRFHPDQAVVSRMTALQWCLDNAFELVELNPAESDSEDEDEEEDNFKETLGIKRIIEALSCHSWSNMVMKDKPAFRSLYFQQLMSNAALENKSKVAEGGSASLEANGAEGPALANGASCAVNGTKSDAADATASNCSTAVTSAAESAAAAKSTTEIIDGLVGSMGSEEDSDTFEKLFEKLQFMKESAESMPAEERRKYAEQVTLQFWSAIGGNPDEIDGLSDNDDSPEPSQ